MKTNTKSGTESQMNGVWPVIKVAWEISVEKRNCALIGSKNMVIYEMGKLYSHLNNQLQLD